MRRGGGLLRGVVYSTMFLQSPSQHDNKFGPNTEPVSGALQTNKTAQATLRKLFFRKKMQIGNKSDTTTKMCPWIWVGNFFCCLLGSLRLWENIRTHFKPVSQTWSHVLILNNFLHLRPFIKKRRLQFVCICEALLLKLLQTVTLSVKFFFCIILLQNQRFIDKKPRSYK